MAYSKKLVNKIRERLYNLPNVEEKEMMGGLAFMVNDKMCVGVIKDELICRIDPLLYEKFLERNGCRPMNFTGRPMKGWIFIDQFGMNKKKEFDFWIERALDFNKKAKSTKRNST